MKYPKEKRISKIKITESFLDGLIWSSCRYFIGRHTIHAHSAAKELTEFLRDNPTIISPERRKALAKDIRERINENIHWVGNVVVEGQQSESRPDALILLTQKCAEILQDPNKHYVSYWDWKQSDGKMSEVEFNPASYQWHIDLNKQEVTFKKEELNVSAIGPMNIESAISDLTVWSKLAGWLDPYLTITAGEEIKDAPGFYFPLFGRYEGDEYCHIKVEAVTTDAYIKQPWHDMYIASEYITEVK